MLEIPANLLEAIRYFADEQKCIDLVAYLRWTNGTPVCPYCDAEENGRKHYWLAAQRRWKCYACRKQFSVKVGTIFEDSAVSLDKWLIALWMLCNCKNGVSSHEISRDLKVTQRSAWFMLHRLRAALAGGSVMKMGGNGDPVEVDETFVGGRLKNMHRSVVREKFKGMSVASSRVTNKAIVMGMRDRETRRVRAKVIPNVNRETLQNEILENVEKGSKVYTDNATAYYSLPEKQFVHDTVNHLQEYVRGEVHTNGIENFWSLLKRGLKGTYVAVEPFHLNAYVAEQVFRFNNRATKDNPLTDADRFALAVSQIGGKRLTYAALTGKVPPSF
jgi:transposase-like protein